MGHNRLQLAAMAIFVAGFVLAGSGWSLVLTGKMQNKADWSICGQDLCSCLPTTATEPFCPLCIVGDDGKIESACSGSESTPTDSPKRVPQNKSFEATSTASQAGCASIFLSFVFGTRQSDRLGDNSSSTDLIGQDNAPLEPLIDRPTPPPRA